MAKKPARKSPPVVEPEEVEVAPPDTASPESSGVNPVLPVTNDVSGQAAAPIEAVSLDSVLAAEPSMPEVQEHAIAAARERAAEAEAVPAPSQPGVPVKGQTDERGRPFDPAIHEVGPDGKAVVGKRTGYLRMRKGGAAKGAAAKPTRSKVQPADRAAGPAASLDAAQQADVLRQKIASTAAVTAEMIFMCGQFVSDEFAPESGEREGMTAAWVNYYTIRGVIDMPPEIMIGVALIGYVGKRWNAPKFSEKRKGWVAAWRGRKSEAEEKKQADSAIAAPAV